MQNSDSEKKTSNEEAGDFPPSLPRQISGPPLHPAQRQAIAEQLRQMRDRGRPEKRHQMVTSPLPGMEWNPLKGLPRNRPCPCRSGKKFKACHLDKLPPAVPEKLAKVYRDMIASGKEIRFITEENEADRAPSADPASGDQGK
jgi:hypothetical protein